MNTSRYLTHSCSLLSFCAISTDSCHAATANLLREITMVRDNFLTLPGWFTRDDIKDIIFSIRVS